MAVFPWSGQRWESVDVIINRSQYAASWRKDKCVVKGDVSVVLMLLIIFAVGNSLGKHYSQPREDWMLFVWHNSHSNSLTCFFQARRSKKEALQHAKMEEALRKARVCRILCIKEKLFEQIYICQKWIEHIVFSDTDEFFKSLSLCIE